MNIKAALEIDEVTDVINTEVKVNKGSSNAYIPISNKYANKKVIVLVKK